MQRLGDPAQDVGPVAVFVASEDARSVTEDTWIVLDDGHVGGVEGDASPSHLHPE